MSYIMTITGPSCAGKTHLLNTLIKNYPEVFERVVSDTSRAQRSNEPENEYHHITTQEFKGNLRRGLYCQWVHLNGVYYGTRYDEIERISATGKTPIRIVEPTGVPQFLEVCSVVDMDLFSIYVDEDPRILLQRWLRRYKDDPTADDEYYALRVFKTIAEEIRWRDTQTFDFYYDGRAGNEAEMQYLLSRIASGALPKSNIRFLTPKMAS